MLSIEDPYALNQEQYDAALGLVRDSHDLVQRYWHDVTVQTEDFTNEGTVEARSGNLYFVGAVSNLSGGTLTVNQRLKRMIDMNGHLVERVDDEQHAAPLHASHRMAEHRRRRHQRGRAGE